MSEPPRAVPATSPTDLAARLLAGGFLAAVVSWGVFVAGHSVGWTQDVSTAAAVMSALVVFGFVAAGAWRFARRSATGGSVEPGWFNRFLPIAATLFFTGVFLFVFKVRNDEIALFPPSAPAPPAPMAVGHSHLPAPGHLDLEPMYPAGAGNLDQPWLIGLDGPELNLGWAETTLGVGYDTGAAIDAALRDTHAEYERLLDAHTKVAFDGRAVLFTVEPFPEELDRLTDEFRSRVDPLLNEEQQAIMRYNFPLRYDPTDAQWLRRYEGKFLPIGDGGPPNEIKRPTVIRIEPSGRWYRWDLNLPEVRTERETAQLPPWLRRWQERFDLLASLRAAGSTIDPNRPPPIARKPSSLAAAPPTDPTADFDAWPDSFGDAPSGGPGPDFGTDPLAR